MFISDVWKTNLSIWWVGVQRLSTRSTPKDDWITCALGTSAFNQPKLNNGLSPACAQQRTRMRWPWQQGTRSENVFPLLEQQLTEKIEEVYSYRVVEAESVPEKKTEGLPQGFYCTSLQLQTAASSSKLWLPCNRASLLGAKGGQRRSEVLDKTSIMELVDENYWEGWSCLGTYALAHLRASCINDEE